MVESCWSTTQNKNILKNYLGLIFWLQGIEHETRAWHVFLLSSSSSQLLTIAILCIVSTLETVYNL